MFCFPLNQSSLFILLYYGKISRGAFIHLFAYLTTRTSAFLRSRQKIDLDLGVQAFGLYCLNDLDLGVQAFLAFIVLTTRTSASLRSRQKIDLDLGVQAFGLYCLNDLDLGVLAF